VNLTTQQRTTIRQTIVRENVRPLSGVNFSVGVGTVIPSTVEFYDVPASVITVYPGFRGYKYVVVGDDIVVIEPGTRRIVEVIRG